VLRESSDAARGRGPWWCSAGTRVRRRFGAVLRSTKNGALSGASWIASVSACADPAKPFRAHVVERGVFFRSRMARGNEIGCQLAVSVFDGIAAHGRRAAHRRMVAIADMVPTSTCGRARAGDGRIVWCDARSVAARVAGLTMIDGARVLAYCGRSAALNSTCADAYWLVTTGFVTLPGRAWTPSEDGFVLLGVRASAHARGRHVVAFDVLRVSAGDRSRRACISTSGCAGAPLGFPSGPPAGITSSPPAGRCVGARGARRVGCVEPCSMCSRPCLDDDIRRGATSSPRPSSLVFVQLARRFRRQGPVELGLKIALRLVYGMRFGGGAGLVARIRLPRRFRSRIRGMGDGAGVTPGHVAR
jgi:hypothetical protein